jgi:hypothetical protein
MSYATSYLRYRMYDIQGKNLRHRRYDIVGYHSIVLWPTISYHVHTISRSLAECRTHSPPSTLAGPACSTVTRSPQHSLAAHTGTHRTRSAQHSLSAPESSSTRSQHPPAAAAHARSIRMPLALAAAHARPALAAPDLWCRVLTYYVVS